MWVSLPMLVLTLTIRWLLYVLTEWQGVCANSVLRSMLGDTSVHLRYNYMPFRRFGSYFRGNQILSRCRNIQIVRFN
jgi:hypothetical protein